jgi:DNA ligase (NAD+)
MSSIVIYQSKEGNIQLEVNFSEEMVWLSLNQMAELFDRDKSVISRHLANIFKSDELQKIETVAKFATVQQEGSKNVTREIEYYNLDAILSVGYRVNSKQGSNFRKWASQVLKDYLIQGYSLHKEQLAKKGVAELQRVIDLLQKTLNNNQLVNDIGQETLGIILNYSKTWHLLLAYDENTLKFPDKTSSSILLKYTDAIKAIQSLKENLAQRREASALFGQERDHALQSILNNIEQTFFCENLYRTKEEKAANLLYFLIKDHPFTDGNKRIACFLFLLYLKLQNIAVNFNDNALIALALLIAESDPEQKDLMVRLIVNLLTSC